MALGLPSDYQARILPMISLWYDVPGTELFWAALRRISLMTCCLRAAFLRKKGMSLERPPGPVLAARAIALSPFTLVLSMPFWCMSWAAERRFGGSRLRSLSGMGGLTKNV